MHIFTEALLFAIPCWLVNMSLNLIYIAKLYFPSIIFTDKPLDKNKNAWDGQRIFGNSTTLLGIVVAITTGIIVKLYFTENWEQGHVFGIVTGLAVYCGHALGSFIKRRLNYKDGEFMPGVDHGDYIVVAGIIFGLMQQFSWSSIIVAILLTYIVHPIVTYLAYLLKWHKQPY